MSSQIEEVSQLTETIKEVLKSAFEKKEKEMDEKMKEVKKEMDEKVEELKKEQRDTFEDLCTCPICASLFDLGNRIPKVLKCGHTHCASCLQAVFKTAGTNKPRCPTCRNEIIKTFSIYPTNFMLTSVIEKLNSLSL